MDKGTLVRTIILVLGLVNQILISAGLNPIPGTETTWGVVISSIITIVAAGLAWFKNNYVTAKGIKQKEVLKRAGLTKSK